MRRILWITRQDTRPLDSGELIYSGGLLESLAATGEFEITVLAHDAKKAAGNGPDVRWKLTGPIPTTRWKAMFTGWPADAWRLGNPRSRAALRELLVETTWDWVVIDQAACAWAMDELARHRERWGKLAYIAHNHEGEVRRQVAGEGEGPWPMRMALRFDAHKYAAMEDRLVAASHLLTAITPRDEQLFLSAHPGKTTLCLPPGYVGKPHDGPGVNADTPLAVVLAGAFEWLAKRRNLESFLAAAAPVFPSHGIAFTVVGKAPDGYFDALKEKFPWCEFACNVPSIAPWLDRARIGLIPEALGGGFKLKALDYIFRGLPVAAIRPALSGLPIDPGQDAIVAGDQEGLARAIATRIHDTDFLARAANSALEKCRHAFDWKDRGAALAEALR
jgi:glycosyltransferase involved in cell wall biosynthesis